ncbi:helix-turn-helix transcriptional regulator [Streptomyces sp. NBS 14/10]|uniref:helix-turn-helix domain-containing protein n=1 Tax=Streptomyces sp. NBS 14/10 TaxID=1945643 RepID=UPI000B7EFC5C|nr:helix-turn-helix transcriptional regulator [Streptomyces sp. NBS 14/10]KAK1180208.1 helix-turn-helix transcriptional regulator [Streptomyces sp. NBS 14/10]
MALRTVITERQRRLGSELRKLREQAGLSINEASSRVGMGATHLSHAEAARTAIALDRLRALMQAYEVRDEPYVDALVSLSEDKGKGWWSDYRGGLSPAALDLAELESRTGSIRSYESLFIPGILQLEDYTRAIFRANDTVTTAEGIDAAVNFRLRRQKVLTSDDPPEVHAVIHEAALHMRFGGAAVARKQLLRLVELAELPHVRIQVLPFTAEGVSAVNTPFCLLTSHGGALETVQMDHADQSMFLHTPDSIAQYQKQFDQLCSIALPPVNAEVTSLNHEGRDSLGLIQYVLYSHY